MQRIYGQRLTLGWSGQSVESGIIARRVIPKSHESPRPKPGRPVFCGHFFCDYIARFLFSLHSISNLQNTGGVIPDGVWFQPLCAGPITVYLGFNRPLDASDRWCWVVLFSHSDSSCFNPLLQKYRVVFSSAGKRPLDNRSHIRPEKIGRDVMCPSTFGFWRCGSQLQR